MSLLDWAVAHPRRSALIGIWISVVSVMLSTVALLMAVAVFAGWWR